MNEFSLIQHFFQSIPIKRQDVVLGIGDDAACLNVPQGMQLLISTDTLVSGVHFLSQWTGYDIASRAVRVTVSDMAAMAAEPCWLTLALTLPEHNSLWLESFSKGLSDSLKAFHVDLIGGDTTKGPLSMTLTILGLAPENSILQRRGAKPGDVIFVSGVLGGAALAIRLLESQVISETDKKELTQKLLYPQPRMDLQTYLRAYASTAIDISDGLSADLNHICQASAVGACLEQESLPIHPLLHKYLKDEALDLALTGGDDYELCFTVPKTQVASFTQALQSAGLLCYPVGYIEDKPGLRLKNSGGSCQVIEPKGYSHF